MHCLAERPQKVFFELLLIIDYFLFLINDFKKFEFFYDFLKIQKIQKVSQKSFLNFFLGLSTRQCIRLFQKRDPTLSKK
jgi:hypothetical protein